MCAAVQCAVTHIRPTATAANPIMDEAQKQFDLDFVTASEIMKGLGISRAGFLYGRRSGKLPTAIVVNDGRLFIWKRKEVEEPLRQWKHEIDLRKAA